MYMGSLDVSNHTYLISGIFWCLCAEWEVESIVRAQFTSLSPHLLFYSCAGQVRRLDTEVTEEGGFARDGGEATVGDELAVVAGADVVESGGNRAARCCAGFRGGVLKVRKSHWGREITKSKITFGAICQISDQMFQSFPQHRSSCPRDRDFRDMGDGGWETQEKDWRVDEDRRRNETVRAHVWLSRIDGLTPTSKRTDIWVSTLCHAAAPKRKDGEETSVS
ncbi:hypothetical protein B0H14DRAFT_2644107 [Mycena olivaceomarginata]|nr:hypothetical protein B0H14DRAFT_2644107 [Mycena olivaceomarginata]